MWQHMLFEIIWTMMRIELSSSRKIYLLVASAFGTIYRMVYKRLTKDTYSNRMEMFELILMILCLRFQRENMEEKKLLGENVFIFFVLVCIFRYLPCVDRSFGFAIWKNKNISCRNACLNFTSSIQITIEVVQN